MAATFGHLTLRELGSLSHRARAAARQQRVCALFEEIQMAIREGDRLKIDDLMTELAEATAQDHRAALLRDD
jgi:hypothetical protein